MSCSAETDEVKLRECTVVSTGRGVAVYDRWGPREGPPPTGGSQPIGGPRRQGTVGGIGRVMRRTVLLHKEVRVGVAKLSYE